MIIIYLSLLVQSSLFSWNSLVSSEEVKAKLGMFQYQAHFEKLAHIYSLVNYKNFEVGILQSKKSLRKFHANWDFSHCRSFSSAYFADPPRIFKQYFRHLRRLDKKHFFNQKEIHTATYTENLGIICLYLLEHSFTYFLIRKVIIIIHDWFGYENGSVFD